MRKIFLLPAALLALASCSNDSVVEQNPSKVVEQNVLQIYPAIAGVTRGTVWDNSNFAAFKLNSSLTFQTDATTPNSTDPSNETKQFSGEPITKTSGVWTFDEGKVWYWPSKGASSSFTAWAPTTASAGSYTADAANLGDLQDIVVAFNSGTASDFASGVPLKFRHITSQIIVKADNSAAAKVKIEVKGIRLNNIKNGGSWSLPTASTADALGYNPWGTTVSGSANYVANITKKTLTSTAADITGSDPLLLLPQQLETADIGNASGQYLSVLVKITDATKSETDAGYLIYPKNNLTTHGGDFAWAAVDVNTNWEPGKKYIYTLHFTEGGYGKIDENQDDGGNDDPGDKTPDNDEDDGDDPQPGEDVVDAPVKLVLDVTVVDWEEVTEEQDM